MNAPGDDALIHTALAGRLDELEPRLATTLTFLAKLTRDPWNTTAADLAPMRAAGLSNAAIEEATRVALCFNTFNRLADAFDYELSSARTLKVSSTILLGPGYGAAVLPGSPRWTPPKALTAP